VLILLSALYFKDFHNGTYFHWVLPLFFMHHPGTKQRHSDNIEKLRLRFGHSAYSKRSGDDILLQCGREQDTRNKSRTGI